MRRIGKTTFLRGDLIPALEAQGAIVVYVDLWSNIAAKPSDLLLGAVRKTLADLERADSKAVGVLRRFEGPGSRRSRPEELMKALFALQHSPNFVDADQDLRRQRSVRCRGLQQPGECPQDP
ncbi:MAG: hypothetical protein KGI67_11330 [Pseudomonadota bacterium]|nr:hypothetical protein [Pseudomonadota bacterium]